MDDADQGMEASAATIRDRVRGQNAVTLNHQQAIYTEKLRPSPEQSPLLYPRSSSSFGRNASKVNLNSPDYKRFPDFIHAKPSQCIIKPGDILYIPPFCWRQVLCVDVSISVNYWWTSLLSQSLGPMGLRHLPILYEHDRLQGLYNYIDITEFDGFLDMARYVQNGNHKETAILLAAAALEEYIRSLCRNHGIAEKVKGSLIPLEALDVKLAKSSVYTPSESAKVSRWGSRVSEVRNSGDVKVTEGEVLQFIGEVESFIHGEGGR